jgi:hypothetical protein
LTTLDLARMNKHTLIVPMSHELPSRSQGWSDYMSAENGL